MADERIETVGGALKGVTGDPKWLGKSALGAVIGMIPYVGAVWVMGWGLHYQRAVLYGDRERLPEWRDAGGQIKTGFFAMVVGLVYTLPLTLFFTLAMVAVIFAAAFSISGPEDVYRMLLPLVIGFAVLLVLSLFFGIVLWPVYLHVQLYDTIKSGFELKRIFGLAKRHAQPYWTVARRSLALTALSMVLPMVSLALSMGALFFLMQTAEPRLMGLYSLVSYPVQMVFGLLGGLVTVPLGAAVYRLWAGYGRIAYDLDGLAAEPAPIEPV